MSKFQRVFSGVRTWAARHREQLWAYLFIAPGILTFLVFNLFSTLASVGISFTNWRLLKPPNFVGLANYQRLFADPVFLNASATTEIYTFVGVPVGVFLALLLAMALNQQIKGITFFRVAYYMPVISASVAIAMVWMWIFSRDYGILNFLIRSLGGKSIDWLNNTKTVLLAATIVSIWRDLGFKVIIFLAALQDIPEDLMDAAKIDGARWWQQFTRVVLPLISPAILYVTITGFIGAVQGFDIVYNMRFDHDGGPAPATTTLAFYIWEMGFSNLRMGYAATLAIALFLIILLITFIQWRLRKRFVYAEV